MRPPGHHDERTRCDQKTAAPPRTNRHDGVADQANSLGNRRHVFEHIPASAGRAQRAGVGAQ